MVLAQTERNQYETVLSREKMKLSPVSARVPRLRIRIRRPSSEVKEPNPHQGADGYHPALPAGTLRPAGKTMYRYPLTHHREDHRHAPSSPPHLLLHQEHKHHLILRASRLSARPLTTYTSLGSPLPRAPVRPRSKSLGSHIESSHQHSPRSSHHSEVSVTASSESSLQLPCGNVSNSTIVIPPSVQRKAVEEAVQAERARSQRMDQAEGSLTAEELREVLRKERVRTEQIQADLASLRSGTVQQRQEELLEEGKIHGIMRHLDVLQEEKGRMIAELQTEEELLNTTLKNRLEEVRHDNDALRQAIDQDLHVNDSLKLHLLRLRKPGACSATGASDENALDQIMEETTE